MSRFVLDALTVAEILRTLDCFRRDVVVLAVEIDSSLAVTGGATMAANVQRGEQDKDSVHATPFSERTRSGETFEAMMISASVNSINRLDTAFTSGVTAILIIE